jgi:hypothetical protein
VARLSSADRDEQVRLGLRPLAPDERPPPLAIASIVAALLGVANIVLFAAGGDTVGGGSGLLVVYCVVAFALAVGMWHKVYQAVLAFEFVLAILIVFFSLFVLTASTVWDLLISAAVIVPSGWLFWKLVRILARLQAPPEAH